MMFVCSGVVVDDIRIGIGNAVCNDAAETSSIRALLANLCLTPL